MPEERTARTAVAFGIIILLATLSGAQGAAGTRRSIGDAHRVAQSPLPPRSSSPPQAGPAPLPARPIAESPGSAQAEKVPIPVQVLVILDPAHGGTDSGAHGGPEQEGAVEKDLVLAIAQNMRREMERQGVRVVLTRQGDTTLSLDDRASLANGLGSGFFVSLHVASTGQPNTAQAYTFGAPLGSAPPVFPPRAVGIEAVAWDSAQAAYVVPSRRLAELVQVELAQKLGGSPDVPQFAEVRQLRIVAHPALAIELSSVAQEDASSLLKTAVPLANALVRAIAAYRQPLVGRP